tara:strand:+ start:30678 stop:31754 length:1077 start_codon:yes stop_codon:yes gene_type:complete
MLFNNLFDKNGKENGNCSRFTHYQTVSALWARMFLLFLCCTYLSHVLAARDIADPINLPQAQLQQLLQNNFKVLGLVQLKQNAGPDFPLMEFSGLAWDHDQKQLTILSDRGFIIHTTPSFENNRLVNLVLNSYHFLKDKNGKQLKYKFSDSEGLALNNAKNGIAGDTELVISFERKPRIIKFTSEGNYISQYILANMLDDIDNYAGANKSLEAITLHPIFNIITGPERPLKNTNNNMLSLHTINENIWNFKPNSENYGSLVGLTTLPDNRLVALERIYSSIFSGLASVIHLITLEAGSIQAQQLSELVPSASYFNENFEGIAWHKDNRFFMISDDNDNIFQRTLLVYFEIPSLDSSEK